MLNFADYDVSAERGFLPTDDPLTTLPPPFAQWDHLSRELPYLVLTGRVRSALATLETPDLAVLTTQGELERAMLIISALGMAYISAQPSAVDRLPAQIAVPWAALAQKLGRPPMITHASVVLNNWRRLNPQEGLHADNLACTQHFMGGMDEQWFFTSTAALEAVGASALMPLAQAKAAAAAGEVEALTQLLESVGEVFATVNRALQRVYERCDPYIFYHRIRPFLSGWDQRGVVFEGVREEPLFLHGGSAAQSSLIQAYDAALGIEHLHPKTRPFLTLMRQYMPPKHRQFIEALTEGVSIHDVVQANRVVVPPLVAAFNRCIDALDEFRKAHVEIAVRYVLTQGQNGEDGLGTGGTSFVPFLSHARKETKAKRID